MFYKVRPVGRGRVRCQKRHLGGRDAAGQAGDAAWGNAMERRQGDLANLEAGWHQCVPGFEVPVVIMCIYDGNMASS